MKLSKANTYPYDEGLLDPSSLPSVGSAWPAEMGLHSLTYHRLQENGRKIGLTYKAKEQNFI